MLQQQLQLATVYVLNKKNMYTHALTVKVDLSMQWTEGKWLYTYIYS